MKRMTLFKLFVSNQEEAKDFYIDRLGFQLAEDRSMGDYRWLLVRPPDNQEVVLNLEAARTAEEKALVGRQAAGQPVFTLSTDNCQRDYEEFTSRGVRFTGTPQVMPWGTGVMMEDLYGNKIYLSQEPDLPVAI